MNTWVWNQLRQHSKIQAQNKKENEDFLDQDPLHRHFQGSTVVSGLSNTQLKLYPWKCSELRVWVLRCPNTSLQVPRKLDNLLPCYLIHNAVTCHIFPSERVQSEKTSEPWHTMAWGKPGNLLERVITKLWSTEVKLNCGIFESVNENSRG